MNRRECLRTLGATSFATLFSGTTAKAAEGRGKWDDESIAEYTQLLFDWLKANFKKRAATLGNAGGTAFKLEYDYMATTEDKKRQRIFERFAEGRLSDKAAEEHITTCLTEFERVRASLAAAEAVAAAAWKDDPDEAVAREGRIYDSTISAARLTVVLDSSRSMKPYLDPLRKEITRDFSSAYFVEVDGCALTKVAACPWYYAAPVDGVNPFTPDRHIPKVPTTKDLPHSTYIRWTRDAPAALECMVDLMKTDALYWFCDFDDDTREENIIQLGKKLLAQKTKLYVHTLDKKVPNLIATLAERSGGQVVRKKI
ncbi:hypothetical protein OKA04_13320 [Luteolibacter flavescens]|uniref:VWA domain-containing protein n=1 Tax=Luteolibacter flavescens TaxID=1859460 RepID=A0ABT3FQ59_9BACT|nr:hypothetical protein [Luteolibacter flavescens]MCW1885714.1 hypothetical protein [Luteolibacter flavescens]